MPFSGEVVESAVEALEVDAFAKDIESLIFQGTTGYSLFKKRAKKVPISNITQAGGTSRPAFRIPFRPQGGSAIGQGTGDATSLLRGTGSSWDSFAISPVYTFGVCELTYLAQRVTNGKNRALAAVKAEELKNSLDQYQQGLEGLINGDGSGTFAQISAGATISSNSGTGNSTSFITGVDIPASLTDQQTVQVFSAVGGTNRGTATVSMADAVAGQIWFSTALPAGTAAGDILVISGGSGAAASSVLGIKYWNVNSNTGTVGGVSRSKWPSRLSQPTINLNGGALTPAVAQRAQVLLGRAMGPDNEAMKNAVWYCGPDQAYQMANLFYNVQISQNLQKSSSTPDMARRELPESFGGRDVHVSYTATPGRLDLLLFDSWYMGELIPVELYPFADGMTVAPVPDIGTTNGTYLTSHMFAYNSSFNLVNAAPRKGLFITGAAVATL